MLTGANRFRTNHYISVKLNHVIFCSEMTTCFGLKRPSSGHHYKNSTIRYSAVQIIHVIWDPI